jgi:DNA-binding transcriptional ArsR family regulator
VTEEKITLDKEVFKTLASGTRVEILKSLDRRRKTLSELSKQLGMSVSTVKEHLDNLVAVNLIEQIDEGYKWKYYELTKKGKDILHPEDKKIWILLGISALGIAVVGLDLLRNTFAGSMNQFLAAPAVGEAIKDAGEFAGGRATESAPALTQLPYLHIIGFVLFGVLLVVSIFYLAKSRKIIKI